MSAPTPEEIAAARAFFAHPDRPNMGPMTAEKVRVILSALDAAEAERKELQRKGEEVTAFAGLLLLRHPTAENLSPEIAARARELVSRLDEAEAEVTRLSTVEWAGTRQACKCGSLFVPQKQTGMSVPDRTCVGCRRADAAEAERDAALRGFGLLPDDPREIRRYAEVFFREIRECPPRAQGGTETCPCVSVITAHVRRMIVERLDALRERDAARAEHVAETQKFQQETLRTSALSGLLREIAGEIVTWDGAPGDFSRRALAHRIDTLLATPINAKAAPHG